MVEHNLYTDQLDRKYIKLLNQSFSNTFVTTMKMKKSNKQTLRSDTLIAELRFHEHSSSMPHFYP